MRECRPDVIIHVAWSGVSNKSRSDRLQITDNVESSCYLLEAGAQHGVAAKFVGIGSQAEYGRMERRISETDLPQPNSLYGASKLAVYYLTKQLAAESRLSHAWVRVFSTYGPADNPQWLIPNLINQLLDGRRPRTTLGDQLLGLSLLKDVAKAIVSVATNSAAEGLFNLGSGKPIAVRLLVQKLRDLTAPSFELCFGEIRTATTRFGIWRQISIV